jgi:hypothetical protein
MKIEITPGLVRFYFQNQGTDAEKEAVENWLKESEVNYELALQWLEQEKRDGDEELLAKLLQSEDEVLANTEAFKFSPVF